MSDAIIISRHSLKWAQASNALAARSVSLGTWNVVRVGVLWAVRQDSLGSISPSFALGLCSGTSNVYGDATTTHFVGVTSSGGTWDYDGGAGNGFGYNGIIRPSKKVGVTQSNGTNLVTNHAIYFRTDSATNLRRVTFVEITKGSPNYSFKLFYSNDGALNDYSVTNLKTVMETTSPSLTNHLFSSAQTLAVDEGADGTLNAAQFYWNLSTSNLEADAFMVAKIS